jgi:hypothetical protein
MARKRILIGMVVAVVMLFSVVVLTGCSPAHGIPEGKYYPCDEYGQSLGGGADYFLLVEKKKAMYYSSGLLSNKYKIVMEEGKIYFDEYVFTDFISGTKHGNNSRNEAKYDEKTGLLYIGWYFIKEE